MLYTYICAVDTATGEGPFITIGGPMTSFSEIRYSWQCARAALPEVLVRRFVCLRLRRCRIRGDGVGGSNELTAVTRPNREHPEERASSSHTTKRGERETG